MAQTFVDMGVSGGNFRIALPKSLLDYAEVFGLLIEIRAAAVAEDMASLTMVLQTCDIEGFVHDISQTIAGNATQFVVVRIRQDKGGEGTLLFYGAIRGDGIKISLKNVEGFSTRVNGVKPSGSTFASYHDNLDVPADIFTA